MEIIKPRPILLIDMDGVIANYYARFLRVWQMLYPNRKAIPLKELEGFYIESCYSEYPEEDIKRILTTSRFFRNLPPVDHAIKTLQEIIVDPAFDSFICTAPDIEYQDQLCFSEKAQWVEEHLGKEWLHKMILSKDKTLIHGNYLIDDKPSIHGVRTPSWKHVVFHQKYNHTEEIIKREEFRLEDWTKWPTVREALLNHHNTN